MLPNIQKEIYPYLPFILAVHNLLQKDRQHVKSALNYFKQELDSPKYQSIIQDQLLRLQVHPDSGIWIKSFEMLMPHLSGEMFINLYRKSIHANQCDSLTTLDPVLIQENHFQSILELLTEFRHSKKIRIKDEKVSEMLNQFDYEFRHCSSKIFYEITRRINPLDIGLPKNIAGKTGSRKSDPS